MRNEILNNLDNPGQLEKMYRADKPIFKREFNLVFPEIQETTTARIWRERLNFESEEISWGSNKELIFVIVASFIAGLIAKIPQFFSLDPEYFYPRNIGFVVFPMLTAYFAWKQKLWTRNLGFVSLAIFVAAIYINLLPDNDKSDTLILAFIHLPLLLWAALGVVFAGGKLNNYQKRLEFLRYNGDLVVMTTILLIAGGLMTGITLGLFQLIDLPIEEFYFEYIAIWGLAASPIVGTYLTRENPQLVNKVSPVIAKVFTPLLLIMLVIYLVAVILTGKDPYNDREFLMIFNVLLLGVMAIILFSIAETSRKSNSKIGALALLGLSIVTIIVNGIALTAIVFRISEWGITPNRLAVLGSNILILSNLLLVTLRQFQAIKDCEKAGKVEDSIALFLPIYILWAVGVTFVFPILFNFE